MNKWGVILLSGTALLGVALFVEYEKIKKYILKFDKVVFNKSTPDKINFSLLFNIYNPSDVNVVVQRQIYKVYLNDVFLMEGNNFKPQKVQSEAWSTVGVDISFSSKVIGTELINAISGKKIIVKVDTYLRVKLLFFSFNIPYTYKSDLKDLIKQ